MLLSSGLQSFCGDISQQLYGGGLGSSLVCNLLLLLWCFQFSLFVFNFYHFNYNVLVVILFRLILFETLCFLDLDVLPKVS